MNRFIFATAAIFAVSNAIKLQHEEVAHPCEGLDETTVENFDKVYKKAKAMVEAEIEKVGDAFDMETLNAEVGVALGDKAALKAAVIKDGKVDTEALKAGCYKVDNHFKALKEKNQDAHPCE